MRDARPRAVTANRRQIVVLVRAQQRRFGRRSRRHHARHFALHQLLARPRFLHLIADGHAIAFLDQPREIAVGRVIRHAAHRNGLPFFFIARGERDFELARRGDGVFIEQLVEIAQPEHQQSVRNLLLDGVILPHQRRALW